jgi:hypothetical protein
MAKFCYSCAVPLDNPDFKGPADNYCKYCTDQNGKLKPKEEIKKGIAQWFSSWQPNLNEQTALKRAEDYMKSMPAWAE